jgi:ATP-dependent DNA helicase RecG
MGRLLQGEVGSGKTVVATAAMLLAAANGCQAALMAPTEILAEQHFESICGLLGRATGEDGDGRPVSSYRSLLPQPVSVGLLTGGLKESARREVQERIASGEVNLMVGTHALIQKDVEFHRLGLCVVDEQHRFGVMQRLELRGKGASPHLLVMSATPIPRTLALTLYGDLDLSIIDELPPGRIEIKTKWLGPEQRQRAYDFVRKQVAAGRQAFIVCPLIEESEAIEAKAAVTEYERLSRSVFPELRLGLLHGRLSSAEKYEAMQRFRSGELGILVSTPVVEVGVDVPNATVMLIEGADRFGMAQLHQFRGRVGRGEHQSYCLLLSESPSPEARQRLELMEKTLDGFALAEEDLRIRGPGEFFGTRQSGLPDLKMARLSDADLLELARREAVRLFSEDPYLEQPEHRPLDREVSLLWEGGGEVN